MPAGQAGLEFYAAPIRADEIKFISAAQIAGEAAALEQVHVHENGNLKARQAPAVYISDAPHQIEPLVVSAQPGAGSDAETGQHRIVHREEAVRAGIDANAELLVVLRQGRAGNQESQEDDQNPKFAHTTKLTIISASFAFYRLFW